jgi:hypothetical protein
MCNLINTARNAKKVRGLKNLKTQDISIESPWVWLQNCQTRGRLDTQQFL